MRFYYLILFLVLGYSDSTFAQAGKLDSSFGVNGIVRWLRGGSCVALQNNDKIILGGVYTDSATLNELFSLVRYDSSGALDSTFANKGVMKMQVGGCCDVSTNEVVQSNGKIVMAGYCVDNNGYGDYALVRYNAGGTLDNTFNGNGIALTQFNSAGYADYGFDCALQSDGKIVQVGEGQDNSGNQYFGIVRYDSSGIIDSTFGTNGEVLSAIDTFPIGLASNIVIQPDGKIIAGGYGCGFNDFLPSYFALARYNTNGSLDSSFGTNGIVTTFFSKNDLLSGLALQADGKIVAVGTSQYGDSAAISLARYNINGSLDNGFGNSGKLRIQFSNYVDYGDGFVAIEPDGKIIIAGYVAANTTATFALFRYKITGLLDSTFGINGIDTINVGPNSGGGNIIFLSNGKFLVGGGYNSTSLYYSYGIVTRFISGLNTGIINFSLKQNPLLIYPNPIQSQATLQYTLTENENINITLYDMQGKLVQTFIANETESHGEYKQLLHFSSTLSVGNYLLNIGNGKGNQGIKISLVR